MRRLSSSMLALTFACVAGCVGPSPATRPLPSGDRERFATFVQPMMNERCASGGCHGRPDRPLSVYAPGAYRADPSRTYLDEPLTPEELEENMRRISAFALEGPAAESLAVLKPLAQERGGVWHGGGAVFRDRSDLGMVALEGWLSSRAAPDGGTP